jgi:hypothetical protein
MSEGIILGALVFSALMNVSLLTRHSKIRNEIQDAVDKAELDRRDHIRIPFNRALDLGFSSRHGHIRDRRDFNAKPGPHPATLSPARRRNLP